MGFQVTGKSFTTVQKCIIERDFSKDSLINRVGFRASWVEEERFRSRAVTCTGIKKAHPDMKRLGDIGGPPVVDVLSKCVCLERSVSVCQIYYPSKTRGSFDVREMIIVLVYKAL